MHLQHIGGIEANMSKHKRMWQTYSKEARLRGPTLQVVLWELDWHGVWHFSLVLLFWPGLKPFLARGRAAVLALCE